MEITVENWHLNNIESSDPLTRYLSSLFWSLNALINVLQFQHAKFPHVFLYISLSISCFDDTINTVLISISSCLFLVHRNSINWCVTTDLYVANLLNLPTSSNSFFITFFGIIYWSCHVLIVYFFLSNYSFYVLYYCPC